MRVSASCPTRHKHQKIREVARELSKNAKLIDALNGKIEKLELDREKLEGSKAKPYSVKTVQINLAQANETF